MADVIEFLFLKWNRIRTVQNIYTPQGLLYLKEKWYLKSLQRYVQEFHWCLSYLLNFFSSRISPSACLSHSSRSRLDLLKYEMLPRIYLGIVIISTSLSVALSPRIVAAFESFS